MIFIFISELRKDEPAKMGYCDLTFEKLCEIVDHNIIALPTEVLKIKCCQKLGENYMW